MRDNEGPAPDVVKPRARAATRREVRQAFRARVPIADSTDGGSTQPPDLGAKESVALTHPAVKGSRLFGWVWVWVWVGGSSLVRFGFPVSEARSSSSAPSRGRSAPAAGDRTARGAPEVCYQHLATLAVPAAHQGRCSPGTERGGGVVDWMGVGEQLRGSTGSFRGGLEWVFQV